MPISDGLPRRYRYDFFTIWGNGLQHTDEILGMLRAEGLLELLRLESLQVHDMQEWVTQLYGCDTVPVAHLQAKLEYLWDAPPTVIVIFARNLDPQEQYMGEGEYRHIQCMNINRIKWAIRERFNPRVDGKRSEQHVIHASDYEKQTDYFLKMLGHPEGLEFLHKDDGLPFAKPYHVAPPVRYESKRIQVLELCAIVLRQLDTGEVEHQSKPIAETPQFLTLANDTDDYAEYVERFRFTYLLDDHNSDRLLSLRNLTADEVRKLDPILVRQDEEGRLCIIDGVHRAAAALYHSVEEIRAVEFIA